MGHIKISSFASDFCMELRRSIRTRRTKAPIYTSKEVEEDPDDLCLPQNYFHSEILTELRETCPSMLEEPCMYCVRIYNRKTDTYFAKVGYTEDLLKRLEQLNSEFDACGRIIVLLACAVQREQIERDLHKILRKEGYADENVVKSRGGKSREAYKLTDEFYGRVSELFEEYKLDDTEIFDTQRYFINEQNDEWLGTEHEQEVCLGRDKKEETYWQKLQGKL